MSPLLPDDVDPDQGRPTKGGYRLIAPGLEAAEPYFTSLGLNREHVVTREEQLFGYEPKNTTLILVDQPQLSHCDQNLLARVRAMDFMGARLLTYAEAVLEFRTYVRPRPRKPGTSR